MVIKVKEILPSTPKINQENQDEPKVISLASPSLSSSDLIKKPKSQPNLVGTVGVLAGITLLSRVLGLFRDILLSALLGAKNYGDIFTIAFRIPNLLRDLFAEGALSSAFQPVFIQVLHQQGKSSANKLGSQLLVSLIIIVSSIVMLGILFSSQIVHWIAPGFQRILSKTQLTIQLTQIMMPFLLLVSLAAVMMGMLNALEKYIWSTLAPCLFNAVILLLGGVLWLMEGKNISERTFQMLAVSILLGGVAQLGIQWIVLRRMGFRMDWNFKQAWKNPALIKVFKTILPATIGLVAIQINIFMSSSFASYEDGANAWLGNAFRLMQLPVGLFAVSTGMITLTHLYKQKKGDMEKFEEDWSTLLQAGLRGTFFFTIPSAVILWVFAPFVVEFFYRRLNYTMHDVSNTSTALRAYALGVVAYSGVKVIAPIFYGINRTRIPVIGTFLTVALNVLLNVLFYSRYGYKWLALSTSISIVFNFIFLMIVYHFQVRKFITFQFVFACFKILVIAILMGIGMFALEKYFLSKLNFYFHSRKIQLFITLLFGAIFAIFTYWVGTDLLNLQESKEFTKRVKKIYKNSLFHS